MRATEGREETDSDGAILRRYYRERDFITSPDGVLKLVSLVLCICLSVLLLNSSCTGAGPLLSASAALELMSAAALAAISAARLLQLAVYAPMAYLFTELVVSTAAGVLLLVTAALSLTLCAAPTLRALHYTHGIIGVVTAGMVTGSAVISYVSVTRWWDAARRPSDPRPAAATEQDA